MTCRNCNKVGHIASFCENNKVSTTNVQVTDVGIPKDAHEEALQQLLNAVHQEANNQDYYADLFLCASFQTKDGVNGGRIPKEWIFLDSQSTTDAFSNPDLLRSIHEVRGSLTIHTQAGRAITKLRGTVPGYGEVWYCPIMALPIFYLLPMLPRPVWSRSTVSTATNLRSPRMMDQSKPSNSQSMVCTTTICGPRETTPGRVMGFHLGMDLLSFSIL
jgi:hypothetical protein